VLGPDPLATNGIGMAVGATLHGGALVDAGEAWAVSRGGRTWACSGESIGVEEIVGSVLAIAAHDS
jgi:hypothetical protein